MSTRSGELLTIEEQQTIMLEEMKAIHNFCISNNIRYTLLHGSLLGAIRHKGFIPWDNDMDIGMPRPDYDRFLDLLNSRESIGKHYYHVHYSNDENFHYQIIRICDDRTIVKPPYIRDQPKRMGVWIDIFPVDGVPKRTPAGIMRRIRLFINKKILIANIYSIREKKDFANRIGNLCCRIFSNTRKRNLRIDKLLRKTPFEKSQYVGDVQDLNEVITPQKREIYENYILVDFDDTQFFAIKAYNKFLTEKYGDYMQLPPESKRMTHQTRCKWI